MCGIHPGRTGTGTIMSYLVKRAAALQDPSVRFIFGTLRDTSFLGSLSRGRFLASFRHLREQSADKRNLLLAMADQSIIDDSFLIMAHPQTLGLRRCLELVERRSAPAWLFLMDSSFFCIKSYNHIPGENSACLRCLGGDLSNIRRYGCKPFPVNDSYAVEFIKALKEQVTANHVHLFAQTETQAALARKHFGKNAVVKTCGIWGEEWDVSEAEMRQAGKGLNSAEPGYDVVFHGSYLHAKGAAWAISLAERCPGLRFLFPFTTASSLSSIFTPRFLAKRVRGNMHFVPLSWDTGLKSAVSQAKVVLVPSLWSAPIEGALVKSIALAKAVAVADNPTSFSHEIPEGLIQRLSPDLEAAAAALNNLVASGWTTGLEARSTWYRTFAESNIHFLNRMIETGMQGSNAAIPPYQQAHAGLKDQSSGKKL